jgi:tripartite motif-containing protein 71
VIRRLLWIGLLSQWLVGCLMGQPAEEQAPLMGRTPPEARRWQAEPVLVEISSLPGGMMIGFESKLDMADLVIYRDGLVLRKEFIKVGDDYKEVLWEGKLTTPELCALLVRIESDGFFDFAPSDYVPSESTHQSTARIVVRGWRHQEIEAYGLRLAVESGYKDGMPEGLKETYTWLNNYMPPNATRYVPERLQVYIESRDYLEGSAVPLWNIDGLSLTDILLDHGSIPLDGNVSAFLEVAGDDIEPWWNAFGETRDQNFREGNRIYGVGVRPILPYEQLKLAPSAAWNVADFAKTPTAEMDCTSPDLPPLAGEIMPVATSEPIFSLTPAPLPTPFPQPFQLSFQFGKRNAPGQFDSPSSIAVSAQNEIVVGDIGNHRLQWFTSDGELLRITDLSIDGHKILPGAMLFTEMGTLLIVDNFRNELYEIAQDGTITLIRKGWTGIKRSRTPYEFPSHPVRRNDGTIYVVNQVSEEMEGIVVLHPDGRETLWTELGGIPFNESGSRYNIRGLGIDEFGNFYVALRAQNRVIKMSPTGDVVTFEINEPMSLRVLADGSFYVSEWEMLRYYDTDGNQQDQWRVASLDNTVVSEYAVGTDRTLYFVDTPLTKEGDIVHHYTADGEFLGAFGDDEVRDGQFSTHVAFSVSPLGDIWVMGQSRDDLTGALTLQHLSGSGDFLRRLDEVWNTCTAYSLAAHSDQSVFVANPCEGTITRYDAQNNIMGAWGGMGTDATKFNVIHAITLASDEQSLYVVDGGNQRVTRWSLEGELLETWTGETLGVQVPISVAVDNHGTFYLLDKATNEIVVYRDNRVTERWSLPTSEESVHSIAYDQATGWVYIGGSRLYLFVYQPDGTYMGQIHMNALLGVQVDTGVPGKLYTSSGSNRINVYEPKE